MMAPPRLHQLRVRLETLAVEHIHTHRLYPPQMQAFLAVPLLPRLVLLSLYDGERPAAIKAMLRVNDEDVTLQSPRMIEAVKLLTEAMDEPWSVIPEGDSDVQLPQILFPNFPAVLVGECVPRELGHLTLKQRLAIYLVLVERLSYKQTNPQVQQYLRCNEYFVREAINQAVKQVAV